MGQLPWVPPSNVLFDLASGNPQSLKDRRRMKFLRTLPGGHYIFDFQGESTVKWQICVHDVAVALSVIRQNDDLSDYDLARALVSQGSPFQTVLRMTPFTVATPVYGIPRLRLSTFKFGPADYQTYCLQTSGYPAKSTNRQTGVDARWDYMAASHGQCQFPRCAGWPNCCCNCKAPVHVLGV